MSAPPEPPADDPTLILPRAGSGGPAPEELSRAAPRGSHTLPIGTRLRDHEITGLIGEGGFGIVYLAWDHSLQRKVAIKEYMPAAMASRVAGSSAIVVKSERHLDTFRAGLKSFVNEARLLARFDHPSLVKVYRFWEENGTAYMVMPFYEGPTLKSALTALGRPPTEAELRRWLRPLLDALRVMHAAQCFHRDIAPDNILLTPRGPLLLDFGAARRVIGDMTHALTVVLKPGYAPIEQYGDVASMAQGAWTDLYALACVVYYAITGHTPASAVERLMDDRLEPLASTQAGRYSAGFLRAIDTALALRPQDRPQDDEAFRRLLDGDAPTPADELLPPSAHSDFESTYSGGYSTLPGTLLPVLATEILPLRASLPGPAASAVATSGSEAGAPTPPSPPPAPPRRDSALPLPLAIAAGLGLATLLVGVFVWVIWRPPADEGPAAVPAPASVSAAASTSASVARPTSSAATARVSATGSTAAASTAASNALVTAAMPASAARGRRDADPALRRPSTPTASTRSDSAAARASGPHRSAGARCSDILQKASLEPLTADEAAYLKRECR